MPVAENKRSQTVMSTSTTLGQLAALVRGDLIGDPDIEIVGVQAPTGMSDRHLSLCLHEDSRGSFENCRAPVVITSAKYASALSSKHRIIVQDPAEAMTQLLYHFAPIQERRGVHPTAVVDKDVTLGEAVYIGPYCVVESGVVIGAKSQLVSHVFVDKNVHIGSECTLHSHAVLLANTRLGSDTIVGPGACVGYEGFSIHKHRLRPHLGHVEVGSGSSIGANTCIDRGTVGRTQIGDNTHLDNLVQVGHNSEVGDHSTVCGLTGIAGSVQIGDEVVLGGQVGIKDHVSLSDRVHVAAKSGVTKNLTEPGTYSGFPAESHRRRLKREAKQRRRARKDAT